MTEGSEVQRLEAADGLALELSEAGPWRIAWRDPDWWGPLGLCLDGAEGLAAGPPALARDLAGALPLHPSFQEFDGEDDLGAYRGVEVAWHPLPLPLRTSVRAYAERPLLVFRLEAADDLEALATGGFDRPCVAWPLLRPDARSAAGLPKDTRAYGHQYTEFALPTFSDASLAGFFLLPQRPAVVQPLWLMAPEGRTGMLAPLDAFHEQVIAVPSRRAPARPGVRCGWHGDLAGVPCGFASELAVWGGSGPRRVLEAWAGALRRRHGTQRPSRYADEGVGRLSYWTDNGAAYWYRSEPGCDVPATLERAANSLRNDGIPVRAFQLDSWFYPHEKTRPLDPEGGMSVPPTGLLRWEPREDLLPEGLPALRRRLGEPPLVLHCRHFSSASPYFERHQAWTDGDRAHPSGPELFHRLMDQAASWGAITFEQDWLVEAFLGVRGLRERPGRARAWQETLDRAARARGLSLQWCMASPADFLQTLTLPGVSSIRTSGDYRYRIGSQSLWAWFLYTNALARALGLNPFKDVFFSRSDASGWDGDPHAEAEALLAALSAGPVGIGDRAGRSDRDLLLRTCRSDGVLVKPDVPLAALERCFRAHVHLEPQPLLAESYSVHPAGRWQYLVGLHAWRGDAPLHYRLDLCDLGELRPRGPVLAYDWRSRTLERLEPAAGFEASLDPFEWNLRILCPLLPAGLTLFGDVARYATAGDMRLRDIRALESGLECDVLGAAGEHVELGGWSECPVAGVESWTPDGSRELPRVGAGAGPGWWQDRESGVFGLGLRLEERGWLRLRIRVQGP